MNKKQKYDDFKIPEKLRVNQDDIILFSNLQFYVNLSLHEDRNDNNIPLKLVRENREQYTFDGYDGLEVMVKKLNTSNDIVAEEEIDFMKKYYKLVHIFWKMDWMMIEKEVSVGDFEFETIEKCLEGVISILKMNDIFVLKKDRMFVVRLMRKEKTFFYLDNAIGYALGILKDKKEYDIYYSSITKWKIEKIVRLTDACYKSILISKVESYWIYLLTY